MLAEASWAGLPVVATAGGGTGEAIIDGVSGTLVEAGDRAALAAAIGAYLGDRVHARAVGDAGARLARERFRPGPVAERVFDCWPRPSATAEPPLGRVSSGLQFTPSGPRLRP